MSDLTTSESSMEEGVLEAIDAIRPALQSDGFFNRTCGKR